jgi:predicted transcriptional regulator
VTSNSDLIELTGEIVAAHVSNNNVAVSDLPSLIQNVHAALVSAGTQKTQPAMQEGKAPAVSVKSSVKPDYVTCLECRGRQTVLKRHLQTAHGLTPSQYRARFGLPESHPLVAPNYAKKRADLARNIGLGEKGRITRGGSKRPKP